MKRLILCLAVIAVNGQQTLPCVGTLSKFSNFTFDIVDSINFANIENSNETIFNYYVPKDFTANLLNKTVQDSSQNAYLMNMYYNNVQYSNPTFTGDSFTQTFGIDSVTTNANTGGITFLFTYAYEMFQLTRNDTELTLEFIELLPKINNNITFQNEFINKQGYFIPQVYIVGGRIDFVVTVKPSAFSTMFGTINGMTPVNYLQTFFENYLSTGNYQLTVPLSNFAMSVDISITGGNTSLMNNGDLNGWIASITEQPEIIYWFAYQNISMFLTNNTYDYSDDITNINNVVQNINNIATFPSYFQGVVQNKVSLLYSNATVQCNYFDNTCIPQIGFFFFSGNPDGSYTLSSSGQFCLYGNECTNLFALQYIPLINNQQFVWCWSIDTICASIY
jgi:hypothetical protein